MTQTTTNHNDYNPYEIKIKRMNEYLRRFEFITDNKFNDIVYSEVNNDA